MSDDTYDDFDERSDLAVADETIRRLKAENERLRAELSEAHNSELEWKLALETCHAENERLRADAKSLMSQMDHLRKVHEGENREGAEVAARYLARIEAALAKCALVKTWDPGAVDAAEEIEAALKGEGEKRG